MKTPRSRGWVWALILPAAVCCWACQKPLIQEINLGAETVRAEILTEKNRVLRSDSSDRNRYVSGWKFFKEEGRARVGVTKPVSFFEMVQLDERPRRILLKGLQADERPTGVDVTVGAEHLGRFDGGEDTEITVPASAGHGVLPVRLAFSPNNHVSLDSIRLVKPKPRGDVEFQNETIRQSGWSMVRWTIRVGEAPTLQGSFTPPESPTPDQCFVAEFRCEQSGPKKLFTWCATDENSRPSMSINEPLGGVRGLCQIEILASGAGKPGIWELRVRSSFPNRSVKKSKTRKTPKAVIVYVLDALRADAVGFLGSREARTPNMDALARDAATFANHFSDAPSTIPSTKSLFLGVPFLDGKGLPEHRPATLAEVFRAAGYKTASFSSNPALSKEFGITAGFDTVVYLEGVEDFSKGARSTNDSAERVHKAVSDWLASIGQDDRFFVYIHTLNPHNPYTPPEDVLSQFVDTKDRRPLGTTRELVDIRDQTIAASKVIRDRIRKAYAAGVTYNDSFLTDFVNKLEDRFGPDEVLLVMTADHGEELFDHGGVLHGYTLYDEMLRIPLMIRWPGVIKPHRIVSQTCSLDVSATLRALVGPEGLGDRGAGRSLWPLLDGNEDSGEPRTVFAFAPAIPGTAVMGRMPGLKLIETQTHQFHTGMGFHLGRSFDGEYRFDVGVDPKEMHNLGATDDLATEWLRTEIRAWRSQWESRFSGTTTQALDEASRRRLQALGYVVD